MFDLVVTVFIVAMCVGKAFMGGNCLVMVEEFRSGWLRIVSHTPLVSNHPAI